MQRLTAKIRGDKMCLPCARSGQRRERMGDILYDLVTHMA